MTGKGRGLSERVGLGYECAQPNYYLHSLTNAGSVSTFALSFNGFCFDKPTSGSYQLSALSTNCISQVGGDMIRYTFLSVCLDVNRYILVVYHLFLCYHLCLAGVNYFKWILFIS